jgi:hypothetical protein
VTPVIRVHHAADQYCPPRFQEWPGGFEAELVQAAELGQVTVMESSVGHVEVYQMAGVGTSILERPRPLSGHRRAAARGITRYTLICEEPLFP